MWSPYVIPFLPTFAIDKLGQAVGKRRGACRHGSPAREGGRRRGGEHVGMARRQEARGEAKRRHGGGRPH